MVTVIEGVHAYHPRRSIHPQSIHSSNLSYTMTDATIKGLPPPPVKYDGSNQRILIVHARWNDTIITSLVAGCVAKLKEQGVKEENIVIKTVPGSYELPFATQRCVLSREIRRLDP